MPVPVVLDWLLMYALCLSVDAVLSSSLSASCVTTVQDTSSHRSFNVTNDLWF